MFVAYEINPKSTYVEVNGRPIQSSVKKTDDKIEINTTCQKGDVVAKESYHKMWQATINNSPQEVSFNENGFIKLNSNFVGSCKIVLTFQNPEYYSFFYLVSFLTMIFVLFNILKKN
jgi:uncharacterized membrane protein YfhO